MSVALESQSEQIRLRMASLRLHMHKDAKRIVANTNSLFDWTDYAKLFPKALVAAGLLTGLVLGPGRKVVPSVNLSQKSMDELLKQREQLLSSDSPQRSEFASGAIRMLTGLALSGVSVLVRKGIESYFNGLPNSNGSSGDSNALHADGVGRN